MSRRENTCEIFFVYRSTQSGRPTSSEARSEAGLHLARVTWLACQASRNGVRSAVARRKEAVAERRAEGSAAYMAKGGTIDHTEN